MGVVCANTVCLFARDQDRAKAFYTAKLGFQLRADAPLFPGADLTGERPAITLSQHPPIQDPRGGNRAPSLGKVQVHRMSVLYDRLLRAPHRRQLVDMCANPH
jgi:catechol 2,3-dioxygenase-like lactoylglutathione lyase family enzyme